MGRILRVTPLLALALGLGLGLESTSAASCDKCDYTLPSSYAIANGMHGPDQQASYFGEAFDVYSKPFSTKYGEVLNSFNYDVDAPTTVALPEEIVIACNTLL